MGASPPPIDGLEQIDYVDQSQVKRGKGKKLKLKTAVIGMVCVLAVVAFGCGGGGGDETIAKAEYLEQGNAICEKARDKRNAEVEAASKKQKASGGKLDSAFAEELVIEVLPSLTQAIDEIAELGAPDPGAKEAEAMVASYRTGIEEVEADPASALGGPADPFGEAREEADALGLKACSNNL